ncbi:MAG: hypothetical protein ACRDBO_08240 [Lachnospiraceae bacterium]
MRKNTKGATMVEVTVAFTVLVLIMAIFAQAVVLTGRTAAASSRQLAEYREFTGDYYRGSLAESSITRTLRFRLSSGNESFSLPVEIRSFKSAGGTIYDVTLK